MVTKYLHTKILVLIEITIYKESGGKSYFSLFYSAGQPSIESSVWSIRNTLLTRYPDGQSSLTCSFQAKSKWVLSKSTASPEVKWLVQKNKQWLDYIVLSLSWIPEWVAGFVGNCCMCIWISFFRLPWVPSTLYFVMIYSPSLRVKEEHSLLVPERVT